MKNLLFLILIIFTFSLYGCKVENTTTTPANPTTQGDPATPDDPTNPEPPEPPTEPPPPDPPVVVIDPTVQPFTLSAFGSQNVFYDGASWTLTTYEKKAGPKTYMRGVNIDTLDSYGNVTASTFAPEAGEIIKSTTNGFILCDIMPKAESQTAGALPAVYSQIHHFSNGSWTEPNPWINNKWQCSKIVETASGEVVVFDIFGAPRSVGTAVGVFTANENGPLVHNYFNGMTADFTTDLGTTSETWTTNFFLRAKDLQKLNGIYYSHNGYEYSNGTGLIEAANAMHVWNNAPTIANPYPIALPFGENPVLTPIGVYGQSILWIECNSGWIVEHRTGTNQVIVDKRVFIGDGLHSTGMTNKATLNPILVGDFAYMTYGGSVLEIDLITGAVRVMLASNAVVEVF